MQDCGEFFREIARGRATDESFGCGQQGSVAGEPGRIAGPQTIGVETDDLTKGVETATMRVAGQIVELLELSENGEVDMRAESTFQVGEGCDFVVEEQLAQRIGGESERSHNVMVSTERAIQSKL